MANLYLRVSRYVAAFWRSTGDGQSLPYHVPVQFSPYTQEYVVLTSGLRIVPEHQQHRASCYSQTAWRNMSMGRKPNGGPAIIIRNQSDWLSYAEVCTLERLTNKTKTDAFEFLCIRLPNEIIAGDHVERVTKSYTLDSRAAQQLRRLLKEEFVRRFLDFETRNIDFAKSKGIDRSGIEIMERFFMEYDLPVSHDQSERETLRRLMQRWRKEARALATRPAVIGDELVTRIDPHEIVGGLPRYESYDA